MIQNIAFAPSHLLAAALGDRVVGGARLAAYVNMIRPFKSRRQNLVSSYTQFDAVVTDHNPFLAAIALRRRIEQGKSCLLVQSLDNDDWPYDLLLSSPVKHFLASVLGTDESVEDGPLPAPSQLISNVIKPCSKRITVCRSYYGVHVAKRQPPGCLYLLGNTVQYNATQAVSDELSFLRTSLYNALYHSPRLGVPSWGRLAIFTNEVVLTGRPTNFTQAAQIGDKLDWGSPHVTCMGSAQFANQTNPESAQCMLEEITEFLGMPPLKSRPRNSTL